LTKIECVVQTPSFKRAGKKLKPNQKNDLHNTIKQLMLDPFLGEKKQGDLSYLRVYKFKMIKQLTFIGYSYLGSSVTLELLMMSSHENFYRDLKR